MGKKAMNGLDLLRRMELICREHELFSEGAGIVIACSGGVDSVVLTDLLRRLRRHWRLRLCVAHFEHGIRGEESKEDALFVKKLAQAWEIPFYMESADVPEYAGKCHLSVETAARELRHAFLQRVRSEHGYDVIALAHHADDQAETVLMRILRGTGIKGLAAMRRRQGKLIRPLLSFRKEELRQYCAEQSLDFREDRTNQIPDVLRNRVRLELLPKLRMEYNPSICEMLGQLAQAAAETQDHLDAEMERVWPRVVCRRAQWEISRDAYLELPPILQRNILRAYLERVFGNVRDVGFQHYEALHLVLLKGKTGARAELPHGKVMELSYGWLCPVTEEAAAFSQHPVRIPGCTELGAYGMRIMTELRDRKPERTSSCEYYCDYDKLPEIPVVRTRVPGDRITTAGGTVKLKKYYIDSKLRREQRDSQPLLVCGKTLLWVIGLKRSSLYRPDEQTKHILYVRVEREGKACHDER